MPYNLEQLLDVILKKIEQYEETARSRSDYRELTHHQLQFLEIIGALENPTVTELAEKLQITKPSTTVMLDKMVDKGYVVRVRSDADRRIAHIHLTEKGLNASAWHRSIHVEVAGKLAGNLSEQEKTALEALLNKALQES